MQAPQKPPIWTVQYLKQVFVPMLPLESMEELVGFNNSSLPTFEDMKMKKQNNFAHTLLLR